LNVSDLVKIPFQLDVIKM